VYIWWYCYSMCWCTFDGTAIQCVGVHL